MLNWSIALIFLIFLYSCSNQNSNKLEETGQEIDSTLLYSFFEDKISPTWNYSADNDSVIFEFDEHGLPRSRTGSKLLDSENKHFSIAYSYNLADSTETVKHLQQFGGGISFTEIRKFNELGHVVWKEEIDVYHVRPRTEHDAQGMIISFETLPQVDP